MIIDFHTHTFPDGLAKRAIHKLSESADIMNYTDGTVAGLSESMRRAGIDMSVILPVATRPSQTESINSAAILVNKTTETTGLVSFGGIHPDNENYREIIHGLAENGVKGIKLHPIFQKTYFDDIRYMRIIECACENNMIIVTHGGYDISDPEPDYATPEHILPVIRSIKPDKLVLAHMGGWHCWDEVLSLLGGENIFLDTSFSITMLVTPEGSVQEGQLTTPAFVKMVRAFGADHILLGSDSPWSSQSESVQAVRISGLDTPEIKKILGENSRKLLGI